MLGGVEVVVRLHRGRLSCLGKRAEGYTWVRTYVLRVPFRVCACVCVCVWLSVIYKSQTSNRIKSLPRIELIRNVHQAGNHVSSDACLVLSG
jgi:hypothetical protein